MHFLVIKLLQGTHFCEGCYNLKMLRMSTFLFSKARELMFCIDKNKCFGSKITLSTVNRNLDLCSALIRKVQGYKLWQNFNNSKKRAMVAKEKYMFFIHRIKSFRGPPESDVFNHLVSFHIKKSTRSQFLMILI